MVWLLTYNYNIHSIHSRHAHLDDPGRSDWEGFPSGTKAAAAGTLLCFCSPYASGKLGMLKNKNMQHMKPAI